jgi:hypothetical protein
MSPDQLFSKYQTARQELERQGGQIVETRTDAGKPYVLAYVPTEEAKNKVWDAIKSVDPNYSDAIFDIRVGTAPRTEDVHAEFDRVTQSAPRESVSQGLAAAFRSAHTPPFGQMVSQLFRHSDGQQRAGLLTQLLHASPSALAGDLAGMFGGSKEISADQAQRMTPEQVQDLASKAEQHDPGIVDKVSDYYAQHPNLVKTIGVGALTYAVSHMVNRRKAS